MLGSALDIWSKAGGAYLSRWSHVVVGITWIGLLYYFNVVQVPAFAEMEAAARNNTIDKLASRALWWFRWSALLTVLTGLSILSFQQAPDSNGALKSQLMNIEYWRSPQGTAILAGILLGLTMFLNVWGVIWPKQKIVIANARNVQAGGEANPAAAAEGRKALVASRMNTIFSLPLLVFMVGTAHFPYNIGGVDASAGNRWTFWIVWIVLWAFLEATALGLLGGVKPGGLRLIYDTHQNALIAGFVYAALAVAIYSVALAA
jgi:uncharacterized membrane protein